MISIDEVRRKVQEELKEELKKELKKELKEYWNSMDEEEKRKYFKTTPDFEISADNFIGNTCDPFGSLCAVNKFINQLVNVPTIDLKEVKK